MQGVDGITGENFHCLLLCRHLSRLNLHLNLNLKEKVNYPRTTSMWSTVVWWSAPDRFQYQDAGNFAGHTQDVTGLDYRGKGREG